MKYSLQICIVLAICVVLIGFAVASEDDIVILYTNDVHAHIDHRIGYAGLAQYKKQMESKHGEENVLMVDTGDTFFVGASGNTYKGSTIVEIMNAVGYDFMAPGNHDFDFGLNKFMELASQLKAKIISCNIVYTKDNSPIFLPYTIVEMQGVKIALIGITIPFELRDFPEFKNENNEPTMSFSAGDNGRDLYPHVQDYVDEVRDEGADIVIIISHLGVDYSPHVIANTRGIDAVIDGHSHTVLDGYFLKNKDDEDVVISQSGSVLYSIGKLTIDPDTKKIKAELIRRMPEKDKEILDLIEKIKNDPEKLF